RAYSIAFCLRFTATAPPEFYTLSLHDALPISVVDQHVVARPQHLADGSRHDRQLPVPRRPLAGDHHFLAGDEDAWRGQVADPERSEEHTSELQSLRHLVCRLLLEKKKQTKHHD